MHGRFEKTLFNMSTLAGFKDLQLEELGSFRHEIVSYNDLMYTATLKVKFQSFLHEVQLILDTGSSDLWIRQDALGVTLITQPTVFLSYGQGSVWGSTSRAKMCLYSLCMKDSPFILAARWGGIGNQEAFQGLLGLGFPALAKAGETSFLQTLLKSGRFRDLSFGLRLAESDEESFVAFGEFDDLLQYAPKDSTRASVTVPVDLLGGAKPTFWTLQAEMLIGSPGNQPQLVPVILDSGTSFFVVPPEQFGAVLLQILGESTSHCMVFFYSQIICNCLIEVAPVRFSFTGVNGSLLDVTLTKDDFLEPLGWQDAWCRVAIAPGLPQKWILGDIFLRKVYAIHDVSTKSVTLVPATVIPEAVQGPALFGEVSAGIACFLVVTVSSFLLFMTTACVILWRKAQSQASFEKHEGRQQLLVHGEA